MVGMKKMWNLEHIHLICACLLCLIFTEESKTEPGKYSETYCMFQDKKYQVGERWNPYLEPYGIVPCLECLCTERVNVMCMKVKCATLRCSTPIYEPSKCCPKCPDQPVASDIRITGKACNYNGTIYQHGEMFAVEGIFKNKQPNQCEQCSCSEGKVYCALKTCPNLTCTSPVSMSDSCCQVCKDEDSLRVLDGDFIHQPAIRGARHSPPSQPESSTSSPRLATIIPQFRMGRANLKSLPIISQSSGTFVQIVLNNRQKVGQVCISNGETYSQGETWHPFLRFYGTVECVLCTCNGTKPECKTIQCPYQYPCEQPKKIEGKCCKVCPEEIESQLPDDQDYFCGEETFPVYEGIRNTFEGTVRKIAFEKNETSEVEIYTWTIKRGILNNCHNTMPVEEFRELSYFLQITRTTLNKWKIFSEGAAQLNQMCENRECRTELEELLKVLYLEKSVQEGC
ncbi:chordin-like protein 1 [Pantherophis guttatus]|uniref:Chordin-like protein 1 n=1 Tax=Pantherophis guttatus TaxID=94885 RepID=A0A6P9DI35_PANGU|nr:chordin-like protein 1 [Pantherophis guttatus]XP_060548044.1 chordin-like protein 1 [Pantherophis guttatus]